MRANVFRPFLCLVVAVTNGIKGVDLLLGEDMAFGVLLVASAVLALALAAVEYNNTKVGKPDGRQ